MFVFGIEMSYLICWYSLMQLWMKRCLTYKAELKDVLSIRLSTSLLLVRSRMKQKKQQVMKIKPLNQPSLDFS